MIYDPRHLVTPEHLQLKAMLYLRQSTPRQVAQNTESARRQYGLRERLLALGFPEAQIEVIDNDQGHSGASTAGRAGYQRLLEEVTMGRVGLVASIEASRLARDNADWANLVKVCALTGTLILDENGIYDPRDRNDRFQLGMKGPVSEQEVLLIRSRFQGAIRSRAERGVFRVRLPVGFVYDPQWRVVLDPDQQVQQGLRHFFEAFRRLGSAHAVVRTYLKEGLKVPVRTWTGPHKGEIRWVRLGSARAIDLLHNPRYAGAYCFGRTSCRMRPDGKYEYRRLLREKWFSLHPGAHDRYLSWEEYERNLRVLRGNDNRKRDGQGGPPREGPALLQGLALCGMCGRRMFVEYHHRGRKQVPGYVCRGGYPSVGRAQCQYLAGDGVDEAVGNLLVEVVNPVTVRAALQVQQELEARAEEVNRLRRLEVDRARYDTDLAHRQYLHVDPENRLVAASLERTWNEKLEALARAEADYDKATRSAQAAASDEQQATLGSLTQDFGGLWRDPRTPFREKKRMAHLIIEDVTIVKGPQITVHVRFKGGATRTLSVPRRRPPYEEYRTSPEVVQEIQRWSGALKDKEIAIKLNERGLKTGKGLYFTRPRVAVLRREYSVRYGSTGKANPQGSHKV